MKSVFLAPARADLNDLRRYIINKFGGNTWIETRAKIQHAVAQIEEFPLKGSVPPELNDFHLLGYYQVLSGMNRIIYQIDNNTIYIHIIADTRRDLKDILAKRLMRT
ncbi:type II toxin-antitoxin system RelE/ParE family toxin [Paraburkholderia fungorum]|uniref:type II toxin-antitoxin system RelE/ParE family toxin n=1 Tax=Paraburkholderia fungorum TaxID=134537 RepID=UPI000D06A108|nr:type II toxin-antitoxin system RelE/ParE family toxin [Paraburkholderia fungorum]PRZ45352.1 plasmid stabilization system protein ParE [Paraburkholderia fungorum]